MYHVIYNIFIIVCVVMTVHIIIMCVVMTVHTAVTVTASPSLRVTCAIDFGPGWKGGPPSPAGMISNWKFSGPSSTPSSMTGISTHDLFFPFSKSTS